jgi:hypothetical protein
MSLVNADELREALALQGLYIPDSVLQDCLDAAENIIIPMLVELEDGYADNINVIKAITILAQDIYQSTYSANGQSLALDGTPMPYRMGVAMMRRIAGLIIRDIDTGTMIG